MESNGMEWNRMEWNCIESLNGMESNGMNGMEWNQSNGIIEWNGMDYGIRFCVWNE